MKKNIVIVILCVLVVGVVGYITYDKINSSQKEPNEVAENNKVDNEVNEDNDDVSTKLDNELKNTTAFAIKTTEANFSLIAVDNNGNEITIYDFADYGRYVDDVRYYYDPIDCIIYLSIKSYKNAYEREENYENATFEIASIDLNANDNNYKLSVLQEVEFGNGLDSYSIAKSGNYIYFGDYQLYKINLDNYKIEKMNVTSEKRGIEVFSYSDNILIYNVGKTIYKHNLLTNSKEKIVENALLEYIYGNELIYINDNDIYVSYNIDTKETKKISEELKFGTLGFSYVVPYKNSYLSYDGVDTFQYNNEKYKLTCGDIGDKDCKDLNIDSYIISSNYIIVAAHANDVPNANEEDFKSYIIKIDLDKKEIKSVDEAPVFTYYRFVTYIK